MATSTGAGDSQNPTGDGKPQNQPPGNPGLPPSDPDKNALKDVQSKAHAHGRTEERKDLLAKLGVTSLEEAVEKLAAQRKAEEDAETARVAEQGEKKALAEKLTASEKRAAALERDSKALASLRMKMRDQHIRTAALEAGCFPEAADLVVAAVGDRVKWDADFEKLVVFDLDDEKKALDGLPALMAQLKTKRDFLFPASGRAGSGFVSGGKVPGRTPTTPQLASVQERINWKG